MLKKLLYSSFALVLTVMVLGMSTGFAQTSSSDFLTQSTDEVTYLANNGNDVNDDDDDTDWGWIGLLGLAGLLGLRKKDNNNQGNNK
ncbi:WGxxGxxG family protein [Ferdinandcohnia sp. Marseille-Q9671]